MNLFNAPGVAAPETAALRPEALSEAEFNSEELAWFEAAPVDRLAAW